MSKFAKVMIALLAIAGFAVPAMSATVVDADGFTYKLQGDIQIQFNNDGGEDEDMAIEYDDLEIKNTATYQIDDAMSVYGKFDFAGYDGTDGGTVGFEEAHIGVAYNNFSVRYGHFDNKLDDFGVETAMENMFSGDTFDTINVANTKGQGIEASAAFDMVTLTVGHKLEVDDRQDYSSTYIVAAVDYEALSVTAAYATAEDSTIFAGKTIAFTDDADAYAISVGYDFGVVALGADYSFADLDDADEDITIYNVVLSAPVGEKAAVSVGYNREEWDEADVEIDAFYANGSYKLASGVKAFAEIRKEDREELADVLGLDEEDYDMAYTVGLQVTF